MDGWIGRCPPRDRAVSQRSGYAPMYCGPAHVTPQTEQPWRGTAHGAPSTIPAWASTGGACHARSTGRGPAPCRGAIRGNRRRAPGAFHACRVGQRCITNCGIVFYRLVEPSPFSLLGWGGPSHKYNKCRSRPRLFLYRRCCGPDIHHLKGLWGPNCYSTRRL